MKLIISNIDWDHSRKDEVKDNSKELPKELIIEDPILLAHLSVNIDNKAENIAEYLNSTYHCPVCGFESKIEGGMKKLTISNIKWDKDDDNEVDLPAQLTINNPSSYLLEDIDGEAKNIADYLSDKFGYCVCGFTKDLEEVETR